MKGFDKMARLNLVIDDELHKEIKEYCDYYNLTYTAFAVMSMRKFLESEVQRKDINETIKDMLSNMSVAYGKAKDIK